MRAGPGRLSGVSRGVLMVMSAVAILAVCDFVTKYLTRYYPIPLIVWARFTFHLLLIVATLGPRLGFALVKTKHPFIQLARGVSLVMASAFFVSALKYMPLAEATAVAYLAPILVTLMSVLFLREAVNAGRWLAVFFGFAGVLTIIRPGSDVFTWAVLLPVGNAISYASYQILTRRLAGIDRPHASIFYAGLVGSMLSSLLLPSVWVMPQTLLHAAALVGVGAVSGIAHLVLIRAYELAPASRLAPFGYSQLIWVAAIGFFAFGDFPDFWSLVGIGVLVCSGLYLAVCERKR